MMTANRSSSLCIISYVLFLLMPVSVPQTVIPTTTMMPPTNVTSTHDIEDPVRTLLPIRCP